MSKAVELAARVDALEDLINKLSVSKNKKSDADSKKPRNVTEKGVLHKAKLLFYQANKDNADVKKMFKANYGEELTVSFKNWTVVKKITDVLFDELSDKQQQVYISKAEKASKE
jgi:hypothetical protein